MFRLFASRRPPVQPIEADDDENAPAVDAHGVALAVPAESFKYVDFEVEEFIID